MESPVVARTGERCSDRGPGYVAGHTANRLKKAGECRNCDGTLFGCSVRELFLFLPFLLHSRLIIPPFLFTFILVFFLYLIPSFLPPYLPPSVIYTYIYSFLPSLPPSSICLYCTFLPSLTDTCIVSFHPPSLSIFIDTYHLFFLLSFIIFLLTLFLLLPTHSFFFFLFPSCHLFIPSLI